MEFHRKFSDEGGLEQVLMVEEAPERLSYGLSV